MYEKPSPITSVSMMQWWEGEVQRAYVLHKARTLHEAVTTGQHAPSALLPAYLSRRMQEGRVMPSVEVVARQRGRQKGAVKRARQEGGRGEEEEACAMMGYVVKDLAAELYVELLAGFHS